MVVNKPARDVNTPAAHLLAGLRTLAFTNLRFRPDVMVSEQEIKSYYDKLVGKTPPAAGPPTKPSSSAPSLYRRAPPPWRSNRTVRSRTISCTCDGCD